MWFPRPPQRWWARSALEGWYTVAEEVGHPALVRFARRLQKYSYGILNHCNMVRHEDAEGAATTYVYDGNGNRTSETRPSASGTVSFIYDYDGNGRLTPPGRSRSASSAPRSITRSASRARCERRPASPTTTTTSAVTSTPSLTQDESYETYDYDAEGRRIRSRDRDGRFAIYCYDAIGRQTYTIDAGTDGLLDAEWACTNTTGLVFTKTVYDDIGRSVLRFDARGNASSNGYGVRWQSAADAMGNRTFHDYNSNGQLILFTDANTHGTRYEYDVSGQRVKTIFHDQSYATAEYDASGRKIAETDQARIRTEYEYDDVGRLTAVVDAKRGRTEYGYDAAGNRIWQKDAEGRITEMEYDDLGRMTTRRLPQLAGDDAPAQLEESFEYDAAGNLRVHTAFDGSITLYDYDINNRLERTTLPQTTYRGQDDDHLAVIDCEFTLYSSLDQIDVMCMTRGADTGTFGIADANGEIVLALDPTSGVVNHWMVSEVQFPALRAGEFQVVHRPLPPFEDEVSVVPIVLPWPIIEYEYTPGGRRTIAGDESFSHDDRGRLKTETKAAGQVFAYGYDAVGNRTSLSIDPDGPGAAPFSSSTGFQYDELNRLWKVTDNGLTTTYDYDAVGNLKSVHYPNDTHTTYTYDALNRLTDIETVTSNGVYSYTYTLGPAGNRRRLDEQLGGQLKRTVVWGYDDLYRLTRETIIGSNGAEPVSPPIPQ